MTFLNKQSTEGRQKVAVVTGATGNLGKGVCVELERAGFYIDETWTAENHPDIQDPQAFDNLPETIDAAIYLAGINIVKPVEEMTIEEWQKVIDINLTGAFRFAKTCLPGLKRAGTSTFVGISSIMATHPYPNRSPYAASKAGLEGLIRQLAVEWGKYGIATQGVRLGHLEGLMKTGTKSTELLDTVKKHVPSGILIQPEDVGSYIAWLCSGRAQAISGGIIDFDPAYSINRWPL